MKRAGQQVRASCSKDRPAYPGLGIHCSLDGLTRVDLLVIIAVIVVPAMLVLPVSCRPMGNTQAAQCLSNNHQLMIAWREYAKDNGDRLPYAYAAMPTAARYGWIPSGGSLDLCQSVPTQQGNWDVDNTIKKSPLWPYCGKNADLWRCPADQSMGQNPAGQKVPRPRSRSMNMWVGGRGDTPPDPKGGWGQGANWRVYRKLTEMTRPGPAMTFVLLDERADSINDGAFTLLMDGYPDLSRTVMVDFPASYHGQAAGIAFADGHAEIHKWQDPRTCPPPTTDMVLNVPQPNNKDVQWLQDHSTRVY